MRKRSVVVISFVSALAVAAIGGSVGTATAPSGPVPTGRHVRVASNVHHDVSPALRDLRPDPTTISRAHPALRVPGAPQRVIHARDTSGRPTVPPAIPSPVANFDGISASGSAPPDTQAAAGPTQVAEMANTRFAVYGKTGAVLLGPENTNTIWSGFGGGCQ